MKIALPNDDETVHHADDGSDTGSDSDDDEHKYTYMANNWVTTVIAVGIWLFVSVLNVYAIYQMAKNGV